MENRDLSQLYKEHKPLLFSIAYRMTGSASEAEDLVQDVFTQLSHSEIKHDQNIKGFLCKMVTNRSLDLLKSSRKKRELYTGTWLPEPISVSMDDPLLNVINDSSISLGVMILFEELNPTERAIFILREVFEYEYSSIADIVQKSEMNCRKIFSRIKGKLPNLVNKNRFMRNEKETERAVTVFLSAFQKGKMNELLDILQEDIVYYADGGGKAIAALHPLHGREKVYNLLSSLMHKFGDRIEDYSFKMMNINGAPGLVLLNAGELQAAISFEVENGKIRKIYYMVNPDKLMHVRNICPATGNKTPTD